MSIEKTKEHLTKVLSDKGNKVIALSGKWGTGKTESWKSVKVESKDPQISGAIYASCFGLSNIDQIKLKLVEAALLIAEKNQQGYDSVKKAAKVALDVLGNVHKSFKSLGALGDLATLMTPSLLKDKLIVLDDIERKHEKLSVDEILGFIDEFILRQGARFLLILNIDNLADKHVWEMLREKVIDVELNLETTAKEAIEKALEKTTSKYSKQIARAIVDCGVTNIRVARRVILATNRILDGHDDLNESVIGRVVPSTVLFSAIHYKGIEDGPDIDFVLGCGLAYEVRKMYPKSGVKSEEESERDRREGRWNLILRNLGITSCDEYEELLKKYLVSGLFDNGEVSAIIERYISEADQANADEMRRKLVDDLTWNHRLPECERIQAAKDLTQVAHLLTPAPLSYACTLIDKLPGGKHISDQLVDKWITTFEKRDLSQFEEPTRLGEFHPRIQDAFKSKINKVHSSLSISEACQHIEESSGWSDPQERALRNATVQMFEHAIKNVPIDELKIIFKQMMMCVTNYSGRGHFFGNASDKFIQACKKIVSDNENPYLVELIELQFRVASVSGLLAETKESGEEPFSDESKTE